MVGVIGGIVANLIFFLALLVAMFVVQARADAWPSPFQLPSLLMALALIMFAVCGSITMHVATRAAKLNDPEPVVRWVAVAIASWFTFLFLEIVEWVRLVYLERIGPHTPFGATFLVLTGTHWLAAMFVIGWLTYVAVDAKKRSLRSAALYSHFLSLWWIVLFFALYVPNATLTGL